jgi:hypothetical protein
MKAKVGKNHVTIQMTKMQYQELTRLLIEGVEHRLDESTKAEYLKGERLQVKIRKTVYHAGVTKGGNVRLIREPK